MYSTLDASHLLEGSVSTVPTANFRGGILASLPTYNVPSLTVDRRRKYQPLQPVGDRKPDTSTAIEDMYTIKVPRDIFSASVESREIHHIVTTQHIGLIPQNSPKTNHIVTVDYKMPYRFDTGPVDQAVVLTSRQFFPVPVDVEPRKRSIMRGALSIESAAKDLGMRLPRIQATQAVTQTLGTQQMPHYNIFERLRGFVADAAQNDDYGLRLSQLARLVLHSHAAQWLGYEHKPRDAVVNVRVNSIVTAELHLLQPDIFRDGNFVYIGNEESPYYRAFLACGLMGANVHVGQCRTVYSNLVSEPELYPGDVLTFVQQTGTTILSPPTSMEYCHVLNNPKRCLAYYYAYAASMGLGDYASAILRQMSIMPFMFTRRAILPYRAQKGPRADAYMYLLRESADRTMHIYNDLYDVLSQAPILAARSLVGCGATIFSYRIRAGLESMSVNSTLRTSLGTEDASRNLLRGVYAAMGGSTLNLEWINPFNEDPGLAFNKSVDAFRDYGWLLSTYRSILLPLFSPLLQDGVDMRNAIFGFKGRSRPYLESLVLATLTGSPWRLESETIHDNSSEPVLRDATSYQHWEATVQWQRLEPGTVRRIATPSLIGPTPVTPIPHSLTFGEQHGPNDHLMPATPTEEIPRRPQPVAPPPAPLTATVSGREYSVAGSERRAYDYASGSRHRSRTRSITSRDILPLRTVSRTDRSLSPDLVRNQHYVATPTSIVPPTPYNTMAQHLEGLGLAEDRPITRPTTPIQASSSMPSLVTKEPDKDAYEPAPPEEHRTVSDPVLASLRSPSPRGREPVRFGTVVSSARSPSPSIFDKLFNRSTPKPNQPVQPEQLVPPQRRPSTSADISYNLMRGSQENIDLELINQTEKTGDTAAMTRLVDSIKTQDGKIALLDKFKKKDRQTATSIAERLGAGGMGEIDVDDWVGTKKDASAHNKTAITSGKR